MSLSSITRFSLAGSISTFLVIIIVGFTLVVERIVLLVFILFAEHFALFRVPPTSHPAFIIIIIRLFLLFEFVASEVFFCPASAPLASEIYYILIVKYLILTTIVLLLLLLLLWIRLILFVLHIVVIFGEMVLREAYLL